MKDEKQIYEPVFKTSVWYEIDPEIREQLDRIEAKLNRLSNDFTQLSRVRPRPSRLNKSGRLGTDESAAPHITIPA